MRALGRKNTCFFGNVRPKSNARAHLKQREKHSGLKGVVNCQNSRDKGPPEGNSARL